MTPQLKKAVKKKVYYSLTSLYLFQKEISHGNDFLTIIEMLLEKRERDNSGHFGFSSLGELLVSDRQTVKVKKMFQVHSMCVVTGCYYYLMRLPTDSHLKIPVCNKTTAVNDIIK